MMFITEFENIAEDCTKYRSNYTVKDLVNDEDKETENWNRKTKEK